MDALSMATIPGYLLQQEAERISSLTCWSSSVVVPLSNTTGCGRGSYWSRLSPKRCLLEGRLDNVGPRPVGFVLFQLLFPAGFSNLAAHTGWNRREGVCGEAPP